MLFLEKKLNRQASHMPIQLIRKALYVYIFTRVKQWINFREICVGNFRKHNTIFIDIIFFIQISKSYNVPTLYCNTA